MNNLFCKMGMYITQAVMKITAQLINRKKGSLYDLDDPLTKTWLYANSVQQSLIRKREKENVR